MDDYSLNSDINERLIHIQDLRSIELVARERQVDLWYADLDSFSADHLEPVLCAEELGRAHRFHFAKDKKHFIVTRALLRTLLGAYLGTDPRLLILAYGKMGKPFVTAEFEGRISFNLAHSGGRAIYAFTESRALGVDLELIREETAGDDIAKRFFSASEIEELQTVPLELRREAFFNCWTRKEAYIKARGEGLSMPLDGFRVSLKPGDLAALLSNHSDLTEVERWEMRSIPVAAGYVAALVVEGHGWALNGFRLAS